MPRMNQNAFTAELRTDPQGSICSLDRLAAMGAYF